MPDFAHEVIKRLEIDVKNRPRPKELPEVDIYADEGVWICLDEACNSSCHGSEWADDAIAKMARGSGPGEIKWLNRTPRSFTGIGDNEV